ncbi:Ig-like domain-containing protein, partial [Candidatus Sumerlaeota bacterium]|nr:Ig-like domain-containing protein [Candidatus Sumerlaeota bacterium]
MRRLYQRRSFLTQAVLAVFFLWVLSPPSALTIPGDVDGNEFVDDRDLRAIINHILGVTLLTGEALANADVNGDGSVDVADVVALNLQLNPRLVSSSPSSGEAEVSVTRETILEFSVGLDPATVNEQTIFAEFGGVKLAARIHLSPDQRIVTLFYDPPLPASARVRVTVDGDRLSSAGGAAIDADDDGQPGGVAIIEFDTLSLTSFPGTIVCGRVFASELDSNGMNVPLEGVMITVDGMEKEIFATTDNMGNFRLEDVPAGDFFVHIDGGSVTKDVPQGAYYPFVGKSWESTPGIEVNIGNIFLPLVIEGTLQEVSDLTETEVKFPQAIIDDNPTFAEVSLMVPADSLFADDGKRGGMVGIAPVDPDRIPGELPPGLNFALVITVQTAGLNVGDPVPTNFDQPVPVCFPNLPDPITGETLAPGAKSALWSFNHDTGRFEIVGPMTVSDDGKLICSDPGSGILAPGWHGSQPGSQYGGGPPGDDDDGSDPCFRTILTTLIGCAANFIPGMKCVESIVTTMTTVGIDCLGELDDGAGLTLAGCGKSVAKGLLGVALSCGASVTPGLAQAWAVIDCVDSIIGAIQVCSSSSIELGIGAGPVQLPSGLQRRRDQLVMVAMAQSYMLGPEDWFRGAPEGEEDVFEALFNALLDAMDFEAAGSVNDGTERISAGEEAALRAMTQPSSIDDAELTRTIERWNRTMDYWEVGIVRESEVLPGESTDFIDLDVWNQMNADAMMAVEMIKLESGMNSVEEAFQADMDFISDQVIPLVSNSTPGSENRVLHWALERKGSPIVLRGTTNNSGRIDGLNLAANAFYTIHFLDPVDFTTASVPFQSSASGFITIPHDTVLLPSAEPDTDDDGIPDDGEFVVATDPNLADTDDDGIRDGAEIQQGTNPLDGIPAPTGVIATSDTPGSALHVDAFNELAVVADFANGVSVFNVFNTMNPIIVAQVDTPGIALAVSLSGDHIAVADGTAGLAIIDLSDLAKARVVHQIDLGGAANAVATAGDIAYAGFSSGILAVVDMLSGLVLNTVTPGGAIEDVSLAGDELFVLTGSTLFIYQTFSEDLELLGSLDVSGSRSPLELGRKLFAGGGFAYVGHFTGYTV